MGRDPFDVRKASANLRDCLTSRARRAGAGVRAAIAATLLVGAPGSARADDVEVCASASEKGQDLRDQGRLRGARALFVECAAARCPAVIRKDCAAWLAQVDEKQPTVAIHARDGDGRDVSDVRVTIDGEVLAERLDGRAIAVDPGSRTFRFERAGAPEVVQTLLLREGDKGRLVDVVLGAPGTAPPGQEPRARAVPLAAWALGGVAVAAFGAGIGFGVAAKSAVDDMRSPTGCAPSCDPARVDGARRDMIVANVLIGVGAAAIATAAVLTFVQLRARPADPPAAALQLGVGAGTLWFSGSF
jgi:hypothetical protein